jgi:hypothetical protein
LPVSAKTDQHPCRKRVIPSRNKNDTFYGKTRNRQGVPAPCFSPAFLCRKAPRKVPDTLQSKNKKADSIYIKEIEKKKEPAKLLHAEPLYIDLIRDLGARKEKRNGTLVLD